jgi:polysaccharide export outer membrane protein
MMDAVGTASNIIEPGDTIMVGVFNTPELSGSLRVDPNGKITLPVGGQLQVSGITAQEASVEIENRLRTGEILLDPHVSVLITAFGTRGVTLLGEVRAPGVYPVRGSLSLTDALAMAGGPTATEGSTISIAHRDDPNHPVLVHVGSSDYSATQKLTPIVPGDTVVVSKAPTYYVVGDVRAPGQYPMPYGKEPSILNILALTQGLNLTAASSKASIVRGTPDGGAETIPVDLDKIMRNKAPNITLEASDVLVVPRSGYKTFMQTALPAITNGAISAGVSFALVR